MKSDHNKKIIPTIIISVCIFLYYLAIALILLSDLVSNPSPVVIILALAIPSIIGGLLLYVTISRIKEIKGGEEDDLSKY